jgi:putative transcriptional regulator
VRCHLERCALCRQETSLWECAGGAMLEDAPATELADGALARMLARLDEAPPARPALPDFLSRFDVPNALAAQKIGRRRFITPSIWFAPLAVAGGEARLYLVFAKAGTVLAEHSHRGRELTTVLTGAFSDGTGTYGAGDFALGDDSLTHAPATTDSDCLCLISAEAPMQLKSFPARLLQAVTGHQY